MTFQKQKRGLALLSKEERQRIASMGGKAVLNKYGHEHLKEIGIKGGKKLSQDKSHMRELGKKSWEKRRDKTISE